MPEKTPIVTILVPALNEQDTIREVVHRLLALPFEKQIIVIDDGSTDDTAKILAEFRDRIDVVRNDKPTGKGAAIRRGLAQARGEITVIQDADLEYMPEQLQCLIAPIADGKSRVVYGSRFLQGTPKGMAIPNLIVNRLLAWSVRLLFGKNLSDEATCYKALRTDDLREMELVCERFEFCPEVTAKAIRMGLRIDEVPIDYVPRSKKAGKKIRWTDAPIAFWTLLRNRFWKPKVRAGK